MTPHPHKEGEGQGVGASPEGRALPSDRAFVPSATSPQAVSPVPASIPSAGHTPGPWRVRVNPRNDGETCDLSICGDIFVLADLTGPQYQHQLPNAHLMAAAPELLAALGKADAVVRAFERFNDAEHNRQDCPECEGEGNWGECEPCCQRVGDLLNDHLLRIDEYKSARARGEAQ